MLEMPNIPWSLVLVLSLILGGCTAPQHVRGYQHVYQGYSIPQTLVDRAANKLREHGLTDAAFSRDIVGRLRLVGTYRNEDEVAEAFLIAQSIVGIKATSPFYPENVLVKNWEQDAARSLADYNRKKFSTSNPASKRALVIGVNHFLDSEHIHDIQGADDARCVSEALTNAGYQVNTVLNEEATKANMDTALANLREEIGPDDTVFIYISSHGTMPVPSPDGNDKRNMSIVAYDTGEIPGTPKAADATEFAILVQNTAVKDTFVQRVAQQPSRITRVFIDTCYSGEMLKDVPEDSRAFIMQTNGGHIDRAAISLAAWTDGQASSKGIFTVSTPGTSASKPVAKTLEVGMHKQGYTVFTATSEGEEAWGPDIKIGAFPSPTHPSTLLHGSYFTQAFFDYLRLYKGDVQLAFDAASSFTRQQVAYATKGSAHQTPRIFNTVPPDVSNFYQ